MTTAKVAEVGESVAPDSLRDISDDQERAIVGTGLWKEMDESHIPGRWDVLGAKLSSRDSEKVIEASKRYQWREYHFGELSDEQKKLKPEDHPGFAQDEPLRRIFTSDQYDRITGVNQHGAWGRIVTGSPVDRVEHSIGVVNLLRRHGAPIDEQLAGALHDIGHGPFSHLAEDVRAMLEGESDYEFHEELVHDRLDEPYRASEGSVTLNEKLREVGFDGHIIMNRYDSEGGSEFPLLENSKPDICADRWEYFIRDAASLALSSQEESSLDVKWDDLVRYDEHLDVANRTEGYVNQDNEMLSARLSGDRQFVMTDPEVAAEAARAFMQMNREFWWNPVNRAQSQGYGVAAAEAIDRSGISYNDFFRMDDSEAYAFMEDRVPEVLEDVEKYFTRENIEVVESSEEADFVLESGDDWSGVLDPETGDGYSKTIDPLVQDEENQDVSNMKRASKYDEELARELEEHERWAAEDKYIKVEGLDLDSGVFSEYLTSAS